MRLVIQILNLHITSSKLKSSMLEKRNCKMLYSTNGRTYLLKAKKTQLVFTQKRFVYGDDEALVFERFNNVDLHHLIAYDWQEVFSISENNANEFPYMIEANPLSKVDPQDIVVFKILCDNYQRIWSKLKNHKEYFIILNQDFEHVRLYYRKPVLIPLFDTRLLTIVIFKDSKKTAYSRILEYIRKLPVRVRLRTEYSAELDSNDKLNQNYYAYESKYTRIPNLHLELRGIDDNHITCQDTIVRLLETKKFSQLSAINSKYLFSKLTSMFPFIKSTFMYAKEIEVFEEHRGSLIARKCTHKPIEMRNYIASRFRKVKIQFNFSIIIV